jgi:hypothetical protein
VPLTPSRSRNERVPHVQTRTKCITGATQVAWGLYGEPSAASGSLAHRPGGTTSAVDTVSGPKELVPTQRQPEGTPTTALVVTTSPPVSIGSIFRGLNVSHILAAVCLF